MSDISITVTSHLKEILSDLEERTERAMEECGLVAVGHAREYCPVGTPESTGKKNYVGGTLRQSISHEAEGDTMMIGTNVEYAPYVEFDERKRHAAPTQAHFLRDALGNHVDEYKKVLENALRN